jgi:serine/threonine-protein kinase RsbW
VGEIASLAFELPTELSELSILEQRIQQLMAPALPFEDAEATTYNLWLSLHELCVNIIGHAYEGTDGSIEVKLRLLAEPPCVEIMTHDRGPYTFDFGAWEAPDLEDPPIHGLGIFLIHQMMDVVEYEPQPGNNRWRLVKYLPAGAGASAADTGMHRGV